MTSQYSVEKAFERVLAKASIPNIVIAVENEEKTYPIVVVSQTSHTFGSPRLQVDGTVDLEVVSIISEPSFVNKSHYDLVEKVERVISNSVNLYRKLRANGLFVFKVYGFERSGPEVLEEEGGALARSTLSVNFSYI